MLNNYPIYIPSKGRWDNCKTANLLLKENVPFYIVVEPHEQHHYIERYGEDKVLVVPFQDVGSPSPVRSWIKRHSTAANNKRHWQLDDNLTAIYKWENGKRIRSDVTRAFTDSEQFIDQFSNVAIAGLKSSAFGNFVNQAYKINQQVYCCVLVLNNTDLFWRTKTPCEDTDYSLQAVSSGWCTVLIQFYQFGKIATGKMKGGNATHYSNDGRIAKIRELQRLWGEKIVKVSRRYGAPHGNVGHVWRKYNTPLELA